MGDELKSEEANAAQDKRVTEDETVESTDELKAEEANAVQDILVAEDETVESTDTQSLSERSSNEEKEKDITRLTDEDSKNSQDFENQEDAVVEVIGSIKDETEKEMDGKENQTGIPEQPIVLKTEEEDKQEKDIEGINCEEREDNESKADEPTIHETGTPDVSSDFEKSDEEKIDISKADDTAVKGEDNHVELTTASEQKTKDQLIDEQDPSVSDVEVIGSIQDEQVDSEKDMTEIKSETKTSSEIKSESSAIETDDAFEVSNEENDESVEVTRAQKAEKCENKDKTGEENPEITSNGLTNSEDDKGHYFYN